MAAIDVADPAAAGHFTTMQVRGGAVQGLDLHIARLRDATLAMFGVALDEDGLRARMRSALAAPPATLAGGAFTLRVIIRPGAAPAGDAGGGGAGVRPDAIKAGVEVELEPPRQPGSAPLRLVSRTGLRTRPGLKHLAMGPQLEARRAAQAAGFDDALLVDGDGCIAEGTFWNIVFWDGAAVGWPDAPSLDGVTQRLLEQALAAEGIRQRRCPMRLDGLGDVRSAFALNSSGVQAIFSIDGFAFAGDTRFDAVPARLLAGCEWQRI